MKRRFTGRQTVVFVFIATAVVAIIATAVPVIWNYLTNLRG